jgi:hypothetical protein
MTDRNIMAKSMKRREIIGRVLVATMPAGFLPLP